MHRYFRSLRPSRPDAAECAALLRKSPWSWPVEADEASLTRARELVGAPLAAVPLAGESLLLAVDDQRTGWVWALSPAGAHADTVRFGPEAHAAWGLAESLLPRVMPVIWRSVEAAARGGPRARWLFGSPCPDRAHGVTLQAQATLDGASYGLSFLLGLASAVLSVPLPVDLAATAALAPDGSLVGVDGLADKLRALCEVCPRVARVLVAADDREEAERVAPAGLQVIPCCSIADAFALALPDPTDALVRLGEQTALADRPAHVRAFFRLATGHRSALLEWRPIAQAAGVMLDRWSGLDDLDRQKLDIARQIALRHVANAGTPFELPAALLAATPQPERTVLLAHIAQQAADCKTPIASTLRIAASLEQHLVRGLDAFPAHLKLLGGLARIWAVTGKPEDALAAQEEAALGWLDRNAPEDVSHPLSEWLRLAGALHDAGSLSRALDARLRAEVSGAFAAPGSESYVACARARALVSFGRHEEALPRLQGVIRTARPTHLVSEAYRALVACLAALERPAETAAAERALAARTALPGEAGSEAGDALALVALDRALLDRDDEAAEHALSDLRARQPGPVGHLEVAAAVADHTRPPASYVARFFPY